MNRFVMVLAAAFMLGGCVPGYTLVKPQPVAVAKGAFRVQPSIAWNKAPRMAYDIPEEENWTQNGLTLDTITFIGALKDGQAIAKQRPKDDQKVPVFRSNMTPPDLVSMVESYYRIKARTTIFETTGVRPATFLGAQAIEFNFNYVGGDEVKRKGRALLAIIGGKLYMMSLDAATLHYFDAALAEFGHLSESATRS